MLDNDATLYGTVHASREVQPRHHYISWFLQVCRHCLYLAHTQHNFSRSARAID